MAIGQRRTLARRPNDLSDRFQHDSRRCSSAHALVVEPGVASLDRLTPVVGEDEHWRMVRRVVGPPAPPVLVAPRWRVARRSTSSRMGSRPRSHTRKKPQGRRTLRSRAARIDVAAVPPRGLGRRDGRSRRVPSDQGEGRLLHRCHRSLRGRCRSARRVAVRIRHARPAVERAF